MHEKRVLGFVFLIVVANIKGISTQFSSADKAKYAEDAGCGRRGNLLDIGACTTYGYRSYITPKTEDENATILTTINYQNIRDVNDKNGN